MNDHIDLESLSALLDGELDARERRAIAQHLEGCSECSDQLQSIKAVAGQLEALPDLEATELEHQRLVRAAVEWRRGGRDGKAGGAVTERPGARTRPAPFRRWLAPGLVAALLVGFGLIPILRNSDPTPGRPEVQAAGSPLKLASGRDIRRVVGALPVVSDQVGKYSVSAATKAGRNAGVSETSPGRPESSADDAAGQDSAAGSKTLESGQQAAPALAPDTDAEGFIAPPSGQTGQTFEPKFSKSAGESCLGKVAATQGSTLVALLAQKADYQGKPAWMLAFAWTPSKNPEAKLDRVQVWIFAPEDCATLAGPALINRVLNYSSFTI
ncbi:MAG: anti-sigma factor family protein [Actinomycetota bacterium]